MTTESGIDRRRFLRDGSLALAAATPPLSALLARRARAAARAPVSMASPYGPLAPVADESTGLALLRLPAGFSYRSFSWCGDEMSDGTICPGMHDGMGVVRRDDDPEGEIVLVRNHEQGSGWPFGPSGNPRYDWSTGGGTTTLRFRAGAWLSDRASLSGTHKNCSGGVTPWGTWLSCEESTRSFPRPHGHVFEVPADGPSNAEPLVAMGRMRHEAIAVDPRSGFVYETEDDTRCGFYRFVPHDLRARPGSLAGGGVLQMCRAFDSDGARIDDLSDPLPGAEYAVRWVTVDPARPYESGKAAGGTTFRKGEGCWFAADEGVVYWVSTNGGAARTGVVFRFHPAGPGPGAGDRLEAFYVGGSEEGARTPDNVTVSPGGGLLLCAGATGHPRQLLGLMPDGRSYAFAESHLRFTTREFSAVGKRVAPGDYRESEFAGPCFDPQGGTLFVNLQKPGITFAIRGPWGRGPF